MDWGGYNVLSGLVNTTGQKKNDQYRQSQYAYQIALQQNQIKQQQDLIKQKAKIKDDIEKQVYDIIWGDGVRDQDRKTFLETLTPVYNELVNTVAGIGNEKSATTNQQVNDAFNKYVNFLQNNPFMKHMENNHKNLKDIVTNMTDENADLIYRADIMGYNEYNQGYSNHIPFHGLKSDYKTIINDIKSELPVDKQITAEDIYYAKPNAVIKDYFQLYGEMPPNEQEAISWLNHELGLDSNIQFGEKEISTNTALEMYDLVGRMPGAGFTVQDLVKIYEEGYTIQDAMKGGNAATLLGLDQNFSFENVINAKGVGYDGMKGPLKKYQGLGKRNYRELIGSGAVFTDPKISAALIHTMYPGIETSSKRSDKTNLDYPEGYLAYDDSENTWVVHNREILRSSRNFYDDKGSLIEKGDKSVLEKPGAFAPFKSQRGIRKMEFENFHIAYKVSGYDSNKDRQTDMIVMYSSKDKRLEQFLENNGDAQVQPILVAQWRDKDLGRDDYLYEEVPFDNAIFQSEFNKSVDIDFSKEKLDLINRNNQLNIESKKAEQLRNNQNEVANQWGGGDPRASEYIITDFIVPLERRIESLGGNPEVAPLYWAQITLDTQINGGNTDMIRNLVYNFNEQMVKPEFKDELNAMKSGYETVHKRMTTDKDENYITEFNRLVDMWTNILVNGRQQTPQSNQGMNYISLTK